MDINEIAEKFIEAEHQAFQQGDFNALEQIESSDIVIHMPPIPDFKGFDAHKHYIMAGRESTKDFKQDWDYVTGDGNVAVLSLKQKMTLTADNEAFKLPAGSTINADAFFVLRRKDDRITEIWIKSSMDVTPPGE